MKKTGLHPHSFGSPFKSISIVITGNASRAKPWGNEGKLSSTLSFGGVCHEIE